MSNQTKSSHLSLVWGIIVINAIVSITLYFINPTFNDIVLNIIMWASGWLYIMLKKRFHTLVVFPLYFAIFSFLNVGTEIQNIQTNTQIIKLETQIICLNKNIQLLNSQDKDKQIDDCVKNEAQTVTEANGILDFMKKHFALFFIILNAILSTCVTYIIDKKAKENEDEQNHKK